MLEHGHGGSRSRRFAPMLAGCAVALIAGVALSITHRPPAPVVPRAVAVRAALDDPTTRHVLDGAHWTSIQTERLDSRLERVSFFTRGQIVVDVVVQRMAATGAGRPQVRVIAGVDDRNRHVPYGNWVAYQPALLVGLCALFVLMAAVRPWRRLRNLDVLASLSLLIPVVLFQHRYLDASLVAALPGMAYLLVRCASLGFGPRRAPAPAMPLLKAITPGLDPARRVRWLRGLLVAVVLLFVMVGVGSPGAVDVLYAVMEGATRLIHGVLPYGHMPPGIIHGDTYPILSYALYAPLAALTPVNSMWTSVDDGLALAVAGALLAAWAQLRTIAGPRARHRLARAPEVEEAGLRAALVWLAFPPLLITVSTGTTDVVLAAMLAVALLVWRRPALCGGVLAVAGWFKFAPFVLVPVSLAPLRGRRLAGALVAIGIVSAAALALVAVLGASGGISDMVRAVSYQFTRGSMQSIWSALDIPRLQPLGQAAVLGLLAAAVVKVWLRPSLGRDRGRMAALAAAVLIGVQLAGNYWAFLYLVWVVPLIVSSLLAPAQVAAP